MAVGPVLSGAAAGYAYGGMAALDLWNGLQQANFAREQANLSAKIDNMNAKYEELDSFHALQYGYTETARYKTIEDETLGAQKTAMASKGLDVNFGTAGQLQADSKVAAFLNTLDMQYAARQKAMGYQVAANNLRLGGTMKSLQGEINASADTSTAMLHAGQTGLSYYSRK